MPLTWGTAAAKFGAGDRVYIILSAQAVPSYSISDLLKMKNPNILNDVKSFLNTGRSQKLKKKLRKV